MSNYSDTLIEKFNESLKLVVKDKDNFTYLEVILARAECNLTGLRSFNQLVEMEITRRNGQPPRGSESMPKPTPLQRVPGQDMGTAMLEEMR